MKSVIIIGAGQAALALAKALYHANHHNLVGFYHPSHPKAYAACHHINQNLEKPLVAFDDVKQFPAVDFICIATPDDVISTVAQALFEQVELDPSTVVFHLSGSLNSTALIGADSLSVEIGSFHPLKALNHQTQLEDHPFDQTYCTIEGSTTAVGKLKTLAKDLKARPILIQPEGKTNYHLAATFASNYIMTIAHEASQLFEASGLDTRTASDLCQNILSSTLKNMTSNQPIPNLLTGPMKRGDLSTIQAHLSALKKRSNPTLMTLYKALGQSALAMTDHSDTHKKNILALLNQLSHTNPAL